MTDFAWNSVFKRIERRKTTFFLGQSDKEDPESFIPRVEQFSRFSIVLFTT